MIMKRFYLLILVCLFPLLASGQALKGSYFSEYSVLRNKLNPAFVSRSSYLGFAGLDNLGLGITSNIGMSNFLFPSGSGTLMTFLHPDVSSEQFLGMMPSNPYLDIDVDTDILNIGFFTGKNSFWSIGLGVKVDGEVNIPKELFSFLKNGAASDPQSYSIKNLGVNANAYAEFSLGYSHNLSDIVKGLSVGGRVKFLASIGKLDFRVNSMDLTMGSDMWTVKADASANLMLKGMDVYMNEDKTIGFDPRMDQLGLAGFGAAFGPVILTALYSRRMTWQAALCGMLCGFTVMLGWYVAGWNKYMYEILPGFAAGLIVILLINRILPQKSEKVLREYDSIRNDMNKGLARIQEEIDDLNLRISEAEASGEETARLKEDLEKQTAYKQEYFKNMSSKLSAKESDLQLNSRFYSVLYKAIQYVAESEGYSLVLKTSDADLVWYHTEIDITDKVIARVRASN